MSEDIPYAAGDLERNSVGRPCYATATAVPCWRKDRHTAIAEAAYLHAERRGFAPGHELEDGLAGEAEIDERILSEGRQF
jgi:hypothetical protein